MMSKIECWWIRIFSVTVWMWSIEECIKSYRTGRKKLQVNGQKIYAHHDSSILKWKPYNSMWFLVRFICRFFFYTLEWKWNTVHFCLCFIAISFLIVSYLSVFTESKKKVPLIKRMQNEKHMAQFQLKTNCPIEKKKQSIIRGSNSMLLLLLFFSHSMPLFMRKCIVWAMTLDALFIFNFNFFSDEL